jgi:HSP20 family protein
MALIQWEAMKDIEELFDRTTASLAWPMGRRGGWPALLATSPRVDIFERDGTYVIEADVPGIPREDLHVSVEDGVLTISGARQQETREDRGRCHRLERFSGRFLRSFTLPDDSDCAGLSATCQEGQLTVTVPRKADTTTTRAVDVPVQ